MSDTVIAFDALHVATEKLNAAAHESCPPAIDQLQQTFHLTFDRWMAVSHLQFGPLEEDFLGMAIAFWPDPRSKTAKSLRKFIVQDDLTALAATRFANTSVAVKRLYALEYLLYDPDFAMLGTATFRCTHIQAITADLVQVTEKLAHDWHNYAIKLSLKDLPQLYFKSLIFGLQQTIDARQGHH